MNARPLLSMTVLVLAAGLAGCAPTLPVIVKPVRCDLPADALASRCGLPRAVADGISFAELIAIGIDDRSALRACGEQQQYLVRLIEACQGAIKTYNDQLVEINQKLSTKP